MSTLEEKIRQFARENIFAAHKKKDKKMFEDLQNDPEQFAEFNKYASVDFHLNQLVESLMGYNKNYVETLHHHHKKSMDKLAKKISSSLN